MEATGIGSGLAWMMDHGVRHIPGIVLVAVETMDEEVAQGRMQQNTITTHLHLQESTMLGNVPDSNMRLEARLFRQGFQIVHREDKENETVIANLQIRAIHGLLHLHPA